MDYSEFLPYLDDSMDELLGFFQNILESKTTFERRLEIKKELEIYLNRFRNMKLQNPDKTIDDHVGAIMFSYALNPYLKFADRDAHYNGVWYAMIGAKNKSKEEIKNRCANLNPDDKRWTDICLMAVDEYYGIEVKKSKFDYFKEKISKFKRRK